MTSQLRSFFLFLASADERHLAEEIQYLKVENQILRKKLPKRISITPRERRRLIEFGRPLGSAINGLISIVTPRTFARWLSGNARINKPSNIGRPRTDPEIEELILRIAAENGWGYLRIAGELKKLGVHVSRGTVRNILRERGIDPGPKHGEGSWHDFIKRHASTLWACDFFSKKIWTTSGLVDYFVLFFIHIESRRVYLGGITAHPNDEWMAQQARNFCMHATEQSDGKKYLIHDCDSKFTQQWNSILKADDFEILKVGPRAPNLNSFAERWVLSVKSECLDHFIVFGEKHLRHIVTEFCTFYNTQRPHQGLGNCPLGQTESPPPATLPIGDVACEERLGGLLRHYHREAA